MGNHRNGFTLIEVAIVLVIIGLLLGGILKGQELITGARVRNLISQQDGIKAAFFGFQDRYRALPGDYSAADTNITCSGGLAQRAMATDA
jgi:prepilin-type N-terminal cleavage/methylation domain-containing protein